jgi:hypothetical protein
VPVVPKKVVVKETGQVFASARVAAEKLDGDFSAIYRCLRGERKTHKGVTFEYGN